MAEYEENAAWNIPPTKIRVIRNFLSLGAKLSVETRNWLESELDRLYMLFDSEKRTIPKDLQGPISQVPPSRQLMDKTLARAILVQIPETIIKEISSLTHVYLPVDIPRKELFKRAKFDPEWEKYLVK